MYKISIKNIIVSSLIICMLFATALCDAVNDANAHPMTVTISLPWYIKFTVSQKPQTFEPILLKGKVTKSANVSTTKDIEFLIFDDSDNLRKSFLNKSPYSFSVNDVLDLELIYGVRPESSRSSHSLIHHVFFKYTIGNKSDDVIYLSTNVRSEVDSSNTTCPNCTELEIANAYQSELLQTALDYGTFGTKLLLTGDLQQSKNAVDVIAKYLDEQLNLPHLTNNITQAKFIDEGLLFEMSSSMDVVEILTQSRLLHSDNFDISMSKRNFIEPLILHRIDNPKVN